ncbi:MAG: hypothetical protein K6T85_18785 [Gorillibacterium sp.]|nr:hypothetical protein [Gorillibacterium sp.]
MKRKTVKKTVKKTVLVLLSSIIALAAVVFVGLLLVSGIFTTPKYLEPWQKDYSQSFADPRVKLAAHGLLAASGHNTQPWTIKLDEQNPSVFYLFADSRCLTLEVDPLARQTMVSQGTFLENVQLAGEQLGYPTTIQLFPEGEYDEKDLIASMKAKPVAKITIIQTNPKMSTIKTNPKMSSLYDAMFLPDTNRAAYQSAPLTAKQTDSLLTLNQDVEAAMDVEAKANLNANTNADVNANANLNANTKADVNADANANANANVDSVANADVTLHFYQDEANREKLGRYAMEGADIESVIHRISEESAAVFRSNEREKNSHRNGFSVEGQGTSGIMKHILQGAVTLVPSFNGEQAATKNFVKSTQTAVDHTPGYAMIVTKNNTRTQQVKSGMLYGRLVMELHSIGFVMQPVSQVLEEYSEMKEPYQRIHNEYAPEGGTIQMFFRVGKPIQSFPQSMRRDVLDLIEP